LAEERGLDLVVMSLASSPPVVRLMDYGKFKFESEKKAREAKKKQHVTAIKEIKMGVRIDDHDLGVKANKAKKFLKDGDKVKCTIRLKGREVQHADLAFDLAEQFAVLVMDSGSLEGSVRQENPRQIVFQFQPGKAKSAPVVNRPARFNRPSTPQMLPPVVDEVDDEPKPVVVEAPVEEISLPEPVRNAPAAEEAPAAEKAPAKVAASPKPAEKPSVVPKVANVNPAVQRVKPPPKPAFKPAARPVVSQAAMAARPPEKPMFKPAVKKPTDK